MPGPPGQAPPGYATPASQPYMAPPAAQPASKGSSNYLMIGCVALLVVLVVGGVGGYFGWRYLKTKGPQVTQTTTGGTTQPGQQGGATQPGGGDQQPPPAGGPQAPTDGPPTSGGSGSAQPPPGGTAGAGTESQPASGGAATSGGPLPSPMPTLNSFLEAAGGDDGYKMVPFMTEQMKAQFSHPEIWGQGDFDHVSWQVTDSQPAGDTAWRFEVQETCRDWADGSNFYNNRVVGMTWSGSAWQVSQFDLTN